VTPKGQDRDPIIFETSYLHNSARQMGRLIPITTSMPDTISIILDQSQIDAGSLVQVGKNAKALRRIQEKIMRMRSTLD